TTYDNSLVCPQGSSWQFTVCPDASSKCGVLAVPTVGATVNLTTQINAVIPPPRFPATAGSYGYADNEAILSIPVGGTYWNVNSVCQRYNTGGSTWTCGGGGGSGAVI